MSAIQASRRHVHYEAFSSFRCLRPCIVGGEGRGGLGLHARSYSSSSNTTPLQEVTIAGVTERDVEAARGYCLDLLRKYDTPSYTLRAFIPPPAQDAYLSLRALNIDIARVADATSNPAVGAMRMQFWRDAITRSLALTPPKEPVAVLLSSAAATLAATSSGASRLSRSWLHRLVTAREQRLHNPPYASLNALEAYAEHTYATLLYLTLSALPLASVTADHVASHIGKAQGIVAVLRGIPLLAFPPPPPSHHASTALGGALPSSGRQGSVPLPLDVMAEFGVREESIFRKGGDAEGLRDAVFKVATRANDHLITVREMMRNVRAGMDVGHEFEHGDEEEHHANASASANDSANRDGTGGGAKGDAAIIDRAFGIFMPAIPTQMWLGRLEKADFNVFDPSLRKSEWTLPWRAYWAFRRGVF